MTKNIINIGLPSKGRLKHDTINIFKKNRLNIYSERGERDLFGYIKKLTNIKIKSKFKTFISGGRYDQLTTNLGFRKVSAVGAAVNMNLYD